MMEKAPDAFRTISEVASELDVPQHVLRFWETRFSHIKPMKRGGGRRYYRPADVDLLRGIKHLLYGEGYTIKGVQRILKEDGIRAVQSAWLEQDDDSEGETGDRGAIVADTQIPRKIGTARSSAPSATSASKTHEPAANIVGISPDQIAALSDCLRSLKECRAILKDATNA